MVRPLILARGADPARALALAAAGIHPLLARLWAARGLDQAGPTEWAALIPPNRLAHVDRAGELLADAIQAGRRLLIVADYDCDGATACAVAVRALREMSAQVDFLVPNRFETGYGLSPAVVELAKAWNATNRIFTFGIGSAASGYLVRGLAEATHGAAELQRRRFIGVEQQQGCCAGFVQRRFVKADVFAFRRAVDAFMLELDRITLADAVAAPSVAASLLGFQLKPRHRVVPVKVAAVPARAR